MNLKKLIQLAQKIKERILDPEKPYWILGVLVLMGIISLLKNNSDSFPNNPRSSTPMPSTSISTTKSPSLDTFVPKGFVLVTLQLANADAIDPLIGQYGMVDLYEALPAHPAFEAEETQRHNKPHQDLLIATHLKVIRAPNNQKLFGALVPEESRKLIQRLSLPVFAVIQRPDAQPTNKENLPSLENIKKEKPSRSPRIQTKDPL